jgi:hypothetical protein
MFLIRVLGINASNITSLSTSNNTSNIRTGQIFTGTSGGTNGERSVGIIIRPIQSTKVVPAGLLGLLNSLLATIRQNHHHDNFILEAFINLKNIFILSELNIRISQ